MMALFAGNVARGLSIPASAITTLTGTEATQVVVAIGRERDSFSAAHNMDPFVDSELDVIAVLVELLASNDKDDGTTSVHFASVGTHDLDASGG